MAKILFSFYCDTTYTDFNNDKMIIFYDALSQELINHGNDVLIYNAAFFTCNELTLAVRDETKQKLHEKIKEYTPDLVISFNGILPPDIQQFISCPIIIWAADAPWYWFNFKDILEFPYIFVGNSLKMCEDIRKLGTKDVHYIPLATSIKAEPLEQIYPISLIGTLFSHISLTEIIKKKPELRQDFNKLARSFMKHNEYDPQVLIETNQLSQLSNYVNEQSLFFSLIDIRLTTIASLLELGIEIFGISSQWRDYSSYYWGQLYTSFNPKKVYTLKHNQDIYNSSKLALNVNHPQAGMDGFSWRVYDVLASNACLLAQKNTGIQKLLKPYIDIPMFESPSEAYDLANKLLKDENWRKEIVVASQQFINDNGRWKHNLKTLEEITRCTIVGNTDQKGNLDFLIGEDFKTFQMKAINNIVSKVTIKGNSLIDKLYHKLFYKLFWKLRQENLLDISNYRKFHADK